MTTLELIEYYANLLILQYSGKARAYSTILSSVTPIVIPQQSQQSISFTPAPTSGTFVLSYAGVNSSSINWNDSAATIQTALQTIPTLSTVLVSGAISSGLTIDFVGVTPVVSLLVVAINNLISSGSSVVISILQTDQTLPISVQNAFDINTAIGVQLDVIGKYVGVSRIINTPTGTITLNDSDFRVIIKFAIVQNSSGSALGTIESNMNLFFPGQFIITDYQIMYMSYVLSSSLGSANLFTALIQEKLIPKPMGVRISIFTPPLAQNYFGFSTYNGLNPSAKPFNTYDNFNTNWLWLSYANAITI
jgi:Protein of unknown function (DUF2612)